MTQPRDSNGPPAGFDARWLWLNLDGALAKDVILNMPLSELGALIPSANYPLSSRIAELKLLGLPQDAGTFGYHAAGSCIYCGAQSYEPGSDRHLGDEHIIPSGLGAQAVIPEASCKLHERKTSSTESQLLQRLFDPTRKQRGIKGRDGKPLLKGKFKVFHTVDGVELGIPLPIGDHPTVLFLPRLAPPGILTGRPSSIHGVIGVWLANINATREVLVRQRITGYSTPAVDTIVLAQMLFKIAHAFASAELLSENFEPLLIDFINLETKGLDNEQSRYSLLGGEFAIAPPIPFLHELGIGICETSQRTFVVVRVRLFAYLGAPNFYVVVGTVCPHRRGAVVARLTQSNSRTHR